MIFARKVTTSLSAIWLAQLTWYVNPTTGLDTNDGTAAVQGAGDIGPLKTLTEFFRRVAWPSVINVAMVVNLAVSAPSVDDARAEIAFGPSGSLNVFGTGATVLFTSAAGFTARTLIDRATNTPPDVTDTALPAANSFTGFIARGVRLRTTGGSNPGAIAWVLKDLGAKRGRMSNWMVPNSALGTFGQSSSSVAVNDPYVVEQMTAIDNLAVVVVGGIDNATPKLLFHDLTFTNPPEIFGPSTTSAVAFYGCDVGKYRCSPPGVAVLVDCRQGNAGTYAIVAGATVVILGGAAFGNTFLAQGAAMTVDLAFIVQSGSFTSFGAGTAADLAVFDSASDGVILELGSSIGFSAILATQALWGQGNAGYGLRTRGGVVASAAALPGGNTITGAAGNVGIGPGAGTLKTWAQTPFLVSDIGAGVGTTLSGIVVR